MLNKLTKTLCQACIWWWTKHWLPVHEPPQWRYQNGLSIQIDYLKWTAPKNYWVFQMSIWKGYCYLWIEEMILAIALCTWKIFQVRMWDNCLKSIVQQCQDQQCKDHFFNNLSTTLHIPCLFSSVRVPFWIIIMLYMNNCQTYTKKTMHRDRANENKQGMCNVHI